MCCGSVGVKCLYEEVGGGCDEHLHRHIFIRKVGMSPYAACEVASDKRGAICFEAFAYGLSEGVCGDDPCVVDPMFSAACIAGYAGKE